MEAIVILFVFSALYALAYLGADEKVREALDREGITASHVTSSYWKGSRYYRYFDFTGFARATQEPVAGYAHVRAYTGRVDLVFTRDYDRTRTLREKLSGAAAVTADGDLGAMDFEQRVAFETNQRLEKLMGDRSAFMANDTDGDGVVDSEEWDAVRARVSAEVRAELSGHSSPAPDEPAEDVAPADIGLAERSVDEVSAQPDHVVAEEQPAKLPDGHW